jgi:hypothetical protein
VWWVSLASLADPHSSTPPAALVLGQKDTLGIVGDQRLLIVLDNFEHLLGTAAVTETIGAYPSDRAGNEPRTLHDGEWRSRSTLAQAEAVELFVQRLRRPLCCGAERRGRRDLPTPRLLAACDRLALRAERLAAGSARTARSTLAAPRSGCRSAPERQRTLRDDRLEPRSPPPGEQELFCPPRRVRRWLHARRGGQISGGEVDTIASVIDEPSSPHRRSLLDARDDPRVRDRTARRLSTPTHCDRRILVCRAR